MSAILLPYQRAFIEEIDKSRVVVYEKSRRIGITWAAAYYAVELAARADGSNVYYVSYNQDAARDFIEDVKKWCAAINLVFEASGIEKINDPDKDELAFYTRFHSGHKITALCSSSRVVRGKQGLIIIDEAAFHDTFNETLTSALALLVWGDKVVIVSTHDGDENPFFELVEDIRKGKYPYTLLRTTFDDALESGLYKKIAEKNKRPYSKKAEKQWRAEIIKQYGTGADEELFCIPRRSSQDSYLPRYLTERCRSDDCLVVEWTCESEFVHYDSATRSGCARDFVKEQLLPLLPNNSKKHKWFIGMDFARSTLSVVALGFIDKHTIRRVPLLIELRNVPFDQQEQILWTVIDNVNLCAAHLDARGNGEQLAERTRQKYGGKIEGIKATQQFYATAFPPLKRAFEEQQIVIPASDPVIDDLRQVKVQKGQPTIPPHNTRYGDVTRHADAAVALLLFWCASEQRTPVYEFNQKLNQQAERQAAW